MLVESVFYLGHRSKGSYPLLDQGFGEFVPLVLVVTHLGYGQHLEEDTRECDNAKADLQPVLFIGLVFLFCEG